MIFVKRCQPCLPPLWPATLQALFKPLLFVLSAQSWLMGSTQHSNLNPILDAPQPEPYLRCTPTDRHSCGYLSCLLSLPQIVSDGPNHSHLSPATSLPWTGHQNEVRHDLPLARDLMVQPAKGGEKSETRLWASEKRSFCFPLWFTGWQTLTQENKKELRGRAVKKKKVI